MSEILWSGKFGMSWQIKMDTGKGTQIEFPEKESLWASAGLFCLRLSYLWQSPFKLIEKHSVYSVTFFPLFRLGKVSEKSLPSQQCELNCVGLTGWCPLYQKFYAPQDFHRFAPQHSQTQADNAFSLMADDRSRHSQKIWLVFHLQGYFGMLKRIVLFYVKEWLFKMI